MKPNGKRNASAIVEMNGFEQGEHLLEMLEIVVVTHRRLVSPAQVLEEGCGCLGRDVKAILQGEACANDRAVPSRGEKFHKRSRDYKPHS